MDVVQIAGRHDQGKTLAADGPNFQIKCFQGDPQGMFVLREREILVNGVLIVQAYLSSFNLIDAHLTSSKHG